MSSTIADADATQTGEAESDAQDQQTATTTAPDGGAEGSNAGQDQSKATATLLTEEKAAAPVVPESFDIKLPENTPLDASVTERVTTLAKELGLTDAKHAQAVLDAIHGETTSSLEAFQEAIKPGGTVWMETKQRLEAQALADKEIGGSQEALTKSVVEAKRVLTQYATPEFSAFAEESGIGSHPEFIRLLKRVAVATGEDTMLQGEPPQPKPKSRAGRLYPDLPDAGI